jgi:hypothetical protein
MLDRWYDSNVDHALHWTARACVLAPGAVANPSKLIEISNKARMRHGKAHTGIRLAMAAARLRNGRWEKDVKNNYLDQALDLSDVKNTTDSQFAIACLLSALAQHGKNEPAQAKVWWKKAEEKFANLKPPPRQPVRPGYYTEWEDWLTAQILRKEVAKKLGEPIEDPEVKVEAARRAEFQKLDPDTRDYDIALLLQPDDPRLLLARSRRLTELKRDKEADMKRYFALRPKDFNFWVLQAQRFAGLGDWKLARGCYDNAAAILDALHGPGTGVRGNYSQTGFEMACIRLLTGDQEGYESCFKELVADKQTKFPVNPYLVLRTMTLTNHPLAEIQPTIIRFGPGLPRTSSDPRLLMQLGPMRYRSAQYKEAAEPIKRYAEKYPNWPGRVVSYLWLALMSYKAEDRKEAERWLAEAEKWFAQYPGGMPLGTGPGQPETMDLHDWLEAHVLYNEAKKTIRPK